MKPAEEMTNAELQDEIEWARLHLTSKRLDQRAKFTERHDQLLAELALRQTRPTG